MASDRLYELALQFRKTCLWKRMAEEQLFAVRLSGDRIGYVSVMGAIGQHLALAVYVGDDGLRSYHVLRNYVPESEIEYAPALLNHASIQVSFEPKAGLAADELAKARDYAKRKGVRFAGKNAYPMFFKAEPGYTIWPELTEQDEDDLETALQAALEVAKDKSLSYQNRGDFPGVDRGTEKITLIEESGGNWRRSQMQLPKIEEYRPPKGDLFDELAAARIRKLPKNGVWQMGLVTVAVPISWDQSDKPIMPVFLVVLDMSNGDVIGVRPVALYESRTSVMLNMLMNAIEEYGRRPATIKVEDEYTEALLGKWCRAVQMKLVRVDRLDELRDAKCSLLLHLGGGQPEQEQFHEMVGMIEELSSLPAEQLAAMPEQMKALFLDMEDEMEDMPDVPDWLLEKLSDLNNAIEEAEWNFPDDDILQPRRKPAYERDLNRKPSLCVLSVSIGTGCYRHIRISEDVLLEDLAGVILWAFGFDNDHAHAFFMDNHVWSRADSYYSYGIDYVERTTDEYRLQDTGITKGKQFKFLFDFGDEWVFQCKVLRTGEEAADDGQLDSAEVIRSKGEPPAQYGWEDWDGEDW